MTPSDPAPFDETELRHHLERRAGRGAPSPEDAQRLVDAIMTGIGPSSKDPRPRVRSWWAVAASAASLGIILVAATALLAGLPSPTPVDPSMAASVSPSPLVDGPTRVLTAAELNVLLDRHATGDVVADITVDLTQPEDSDRVCSLRERCLPAIGTIDRGMGPLRSLVVVDRSFGGEIDGTRLHAIAALHLEGDDTVELLGLLDQGTDDILSLDASVGALPAGAHAHGERAVVVDGWLVGPGSMPQWVVPTTVLVSGVDGAALPDDAIALDAGAFSAWTVRQDRAQGSPDRGIYVLRSVESARTVPSDPSWQIVGRLHGVTLPHPVIPSPLPSIATAG